MPGVSQLCGFSALFRFSRLAGRLGGFRCKGGVTSRTRFREEDTHRRPASQQLHRGRFRLGGTRGCWRNSSGLVLRHEIFVSRPSLNSKPERRSPKFPRGSCEDIWSMFTGETRTPPALQAETMGSFYNNKETLLSVLDPYYGH